MKELVKGYHAITQKRKLVDWSIHPNLQYTNVANDRNSNGQTQGLKRDGAQHIRYEEDRKKSKHHAAVEDTRRRRYGKDCQVEMGQGWTHVLHALALDTALDMLTE